MGESVLLREINHEVEDKKDLLHDVGTKNVDLIIDNFNLSAEDLVDSELLKNK